MSIIYLVHIGAIVDEGKKGPSLLAIKKNTKKARTVGSGEERERRACVMTPDLSYDLK